MNITSHNIFKKPYLKLYFSSLVILCIGSSISFYTFNFLAQIEKEELNARVLEGSNGLLSQISYNDTPDPAINIFREVFISITESIDTPDEITHELLERQYTSSNLKDFIFHINLRYIKKKSASEKPSTRETSDSNSFYTDIENAEYNPENGIPDKDRLYSYRPTMHVDRGVVGATTNEDFYGDPTFQLAMDIARDTGKITVRYSVPFYDPELLQSWFFIPQLEHYFFPVYRDLHRTDDIETKRQKLDGFLSILFISNGADIDSPSEPKVGVTAVVLPENQNNLISLLPENIRAKLSKRDFISFEYDSWSSLYYQSTLDDGINDESSSALVIARASQKLHDSITSSSRWWALALGMFLTTWVTSLVIWSQTKTRRVMRLVDIRTRELNEKTRKLEQSNTALNRSENLYRMLANNINDVIFTHDMKGKCTYISPSVLTQTGYPPEEYLNRPIEHYFATEQKELIGQGVQETIKTEQHSSDKNLTSHPFLFRSTCKDGTKKWFETAITTLKNKSGETEGFLGVSRDITARIKAEQEKEKLESEFRQAQKMEAIGNLAGGVAHDFNNLLTGILGHADMMKLQRPLPPENKRSLDVIETAALRARELTSQLLGFARKGQYTLVLVDLNQVALDIISLMERTVDKRIVLSLETQGATPFVMGDSGQISQVILNMAVNSRDAMPEGGSLVFRTNVVALDNEVSKKHSELKPGTYSLISISDTGHGIPADIIDKVFDPFFTNKEDGKGTGMGLAMAYGVIRNHGGFIEVKSEPGKGTEFDIYLPYRTTHEEDDVTELQEIETGSGKVLFVDDEDIIRDLATTMLNRLGYDVLTAENGAVGIEVYRKNWQEISFVIVDIIMPEVDGIDCLRELRRINPNLKAILTTGYSRESVADKLNENLAQEFLEKPFRLKTLASAITSLMDAASDTVK